MRLVFLPKLVVVALGLAGVMKVSDNFDLIPMAAAAGPASSNERSSVEAATALPPATTPGTGDMCESSHAIAAAIAEERALLEAQRKEIADQEARIALAEKSLRAEQARLAEVRDEIGVQLDRIAEANGQDMTKLVELYRNMKPQVAAAIIDEIDIETAVLVVGALPERDAAQILGTLSLVRARAITKIILERSKLPADRNLDGLRLN